jgi:hypothetical protein
MVAIRKKYLRRAVIHSKKIQPNGSRHGQKRMRKCAAELICLPGLVSHISSPQHIDIDVILRVWPFNPRM